MLLEENIVRDKFGHELDMPAQWHRFGYGGLLICRRCHRTFKAPVENYDREKCKGSCHRILQLL